MDGKLDMFTQARIRRFQATGMASPRLLPFDRRLSIAFQWKPAMLLRALPSKRRERVAERVGA